MLTVRDGLESDDRARSLSTTEHINEPEVLVPHSLGSVLDVDLSRHCQAVLQVVRAGTYKQKILVASLVERVLHVLRDVEAHVLVMRSGSCWDLYLLLGRLLLAHWHKLLGWLLLRVHHVPESSRFIIVLDLESVSKLHDRLD
jgi:ABC-type microcin C transport system duplicated ATPase subunit YejF